MTREWGSGAPIRGRGQLGLRLVSGVCGPPAMRTELRSFFGRASAGADTGCRGSSAGFGPAGSPVSGQL